MKKLLLMLIVALIPSIVFATTTTATIGGTLKVYETLSIGDTRDMVWPAQYAGQLAGDIFTSTGVAPAPGITGLNTAGKSGRVEVVGTGGSQFTPSLGAFTFTAGPSGYASIGPSVNICLTDPTTNVVCANSLPVGTLQTLPNSGSAGQSLVYYIQGGIHSGVTLLAGTYTGTVAFTATYN